MISFNLPWPPRILHPNARPHWAAKARAAKCARFDAAFIAKASGAAEIVADALEVRMVFAPPNARKHDLDGCLSAAKSLLDGVADVVGVDDSKWKLSIERTDPVKGGNIHISIEEAK